MNDMVSRSSFLDNVHFLVRCLRYRFRTEKLQIKTMMALQLKGATVLDIGANSGIYCFWMMGAVGLNATSKGTNATSFWVAGRQSNGTDR